MYYCIEDFRKYDVYRISQQYKVHYLDIGGVYLYKFISELQIPITRLKYTNENKQEFIKQYESNMSKENIMEFWGINSKYIDSNYWKFKGIQKSAKYELHNKNMMWCKKALERLEYDCENKGKRQASNDWELSTNEIDIILDAYKKIKAHHRIQFDAYRIQRFIEECERYGCENVASRWGFAVNATEDMLKRLKN